MRRMLLVLSAALMAAMMALSPVSAFADPVCTETPPSGGGAMGIWTQTCVLDPVVTTEEVSTPTTPQPCEVGNSGRQGTQEGNLVDTYQVTKQTTTTAQYQGFPSTDNMIEGSYTEETVVLSSVLVSSEFKKSGPCLPARPVR